MLENLCIDISVTSTADKMHSITGCLQPVHYGNEPSKPVTKDNSQELFLITILVIASTKFCMLSYLETLPSTGNFETFNKPFDVYLRHLPW